MLDQLRADYRATAAAQYSYLVQAIHLTQRGDMAGAQRVLLSFVDTPAYRQSEYAPLALYEAAVNLERQGLDRQLRERRAIRDTVRRHVGQQLREVRCVALGVVELVAQVLEEGAFADFRRTGFEVVEVVHRGIRCSWNRDRRCGRTGRWRPTR